MATLANPIYTFRGSSGQWVATLTDSAQEWYGTTAAEASDKALAALEVQHAAERTRVHTFTVAVTGCTAAEAEQVMAERIGPDEDYGFDYRIEYGPADADPALQA